MVVKFPPLEDYETSWVAAKWLWSFKIFYGYNLPLSTCLKLNVRRGLDRLKRNKVIWSDFATRRTKHYLFRVPEGLKFYACNIDEELNLSFTHTFLVPQRKNHRDDQLVKWKPLNFQNEYNTSIFHCLYLLSCTTTQSRYTFFLRGSKVWVRVCNVKSS